MNLQGVCHDSCATEKYAVDCMLPFYVSLWEQKQAPSLKTVRVHSHVATCSQRQSKRLDVQLAFWENTVSKQCLRMPHAATN